MSRPTPRTGLAAGLLAALAPLASAAAVVPGPPSPAHAAPAAQEGRPMIGVLLSGEEESPTVLECLPGSPAEAAGLQAGDVIESVSGTPTPTREALVARLGELEVGQKVRLRVRRGEEQLRLRLSLADSRGFETVRVTEGVELPAEVEEEAVIEVPLELLDLDPPQGAEDVEVLIEVEVAEELSEPPHQGRRVRIELESDEEHHHRGGADALVDELAAELAEELGEQLGERFDRLVARELEARRGRRRPGQLREVFRAAMEGLGGEVEDILREELAEELAELGLLPHGDLHRDHEHGHEHEDRAHEAHEPHGLRWIELDGAHHALEVPRDGGAPRVFEFQIREGQPVLHGDEEHDGHHHGGQGDHEVHHGEHEAPKRVEVHQLELGGEGRYRLLRPAEVEGQGEVRFRLRQVPDAEHGAELEGVLEDAFREAGLASGELEELLGELEQELGQASGARVERRMSIATVGPDGRMEVREFRPGGEGPHGAHPGPDGVPGIWILKGESGSRFEPGAPLRLRRVEGRGEEREVEVRLEDRRRSGGRSRGAAPADELGALRAELEALRREVQALRREVSGGRVRRR